MWIEVLDEYDNGKGFKNINEAHNIYTQKDENGKTVTLYLDTFIVMKNIPIEKCDDALFAFMRLIDQETWTDTLYITRKRIEGWVKETIADRYR